MTPIDVDTALAGYLARAAALTLVLAAAVWSDLRSRRIPNRLIVVALLVGISLSIAPRGVGIAAAGGGIATALVCCLPLYALHAMGGGDVKLTGVVGAYLGFPDTIVALVYAIAFGGLLTLAQAWRVRALTQMLANVRIFIWLVAVRASRGGVPRGDAPQLTGVRAPYSLAIAAGALLQQITAHLARAGT